MRSLLIFSTLLALFAMVHCRKIEKKEKFVIVVKEKDDQNGTATDDNNFEKPIEKNEIVSRYKSKRVDLRKRTASARSNSSHNATDPKVMYKFEAKDGRMKFQRDVADSKTPESQTESYGSIEYEPEHYETTETPNYSQYQYPVMYYRLCPVPYPGHYAANHVSHQSYQDPSIVYQIHQPENLYRSPKQLVQYVPTSDSFTRQIPNNYESGLGQNYQYLDQQQLQHTLQNVPNYGHQLFDQIGHNQESFHTGFSGQQNLFGYGGQQNYVANNLVGNDPKFNSAYYTDYMSGIDAHQTNYNQPQQSYVFVPSYDSNQNSQYLTSNNYNTNTGAPAQYNNNDIYSNSYGGHATDFGNSYGAQNQITQSSFVDPSSGSYQINVGNKYTDTTSSNNHAVNANTNIYNPQNVLNYQDAAKQVNVGQTTLGTTTDVSSINHSQNLNNQVNHNGAPNYVYTKGNGKVIYYSYNTNNDVNSLNPAFESLKINSVNQQNVAKGI